MLLHYKKNRWEKLWTKPALRTNDLLLSVPVAVKPFNLEISRCHFADWVKEMNLSACRMCIFPQSTNHFLVFGAVVAVDVVVT